MAKGTKRGSPGADAEKDIFKGVEIGEGEARNLEAIQREVARVELAIERNGAKKLIPVFEKRREVLKGIPKFWSVALMRNSIVAFHMQHGADQSALGYLEDVWVEKDPGELRCFKIEFHFKENPYFTNKVLTKEYKYVPPPAAADDKADENGITDAMVDFSWERDVKASAMKIEWKDEEKALTKLYPRESDPDEDEVADPGSFFNFFEREEDLNDLGLTIANDLFPEGIDYFLGNVGEEELDSDDEDEDEEDDEDDDDDAKEIDLEKPRPKKRRM